MADTGKRPCKCGHSKFDHLGGGGRCDEGSHRCRCGIYRECTHPSTAPWHDRRQCTVCHNIFEAEP